MGIRFNARTSAIETDAAAVSFSQPVATPASTTGAAGLNIAEGVAPSSPVDGDVWVTAGGAFNARLNGSTVDLSTTASTNLTWTASTRTLASSTGTDAVITLFTSTEAGLTPLSGGGTTNFLRADGTWAAPTGGGTICGSIADNQIAVGAATADDIEGSATLTYVSGTTFTHVLSGGTAADFAQWRDSTDTVDLVLRYDGTAFTLRSEAAGAGNLYMTFDNASSQVDFGGAISSTTLTDNRVLIAGTSGLIEDSGNLTFDGVTLDINSGSLPSAPGIELSTGRPIVVWNESDAAVDNRRWYAHASAEAWELVAINDANSTSTTAMSVARTGSTVDSVTFPTNVTVGGTSQLLLPQDGDTVSPTLGFGDGDTGIMERGDDILSIVNLGTERFWQTGNFFYATDSLGGGIANETTSATNPTLLPRRASAQTGIGAAGANALSLIANSTEMVAITETSVTINSAAKLNTAASTTTQAGLNIPEAVAAPSTPVDGDVWVTAAGAFNARLNGVTVDLASGGSGTVTSVAAGNGMDFTTITATGSVTMGTPGTVTATSTNAVTATSHTHDITSVPTGLEVRSAGNTDTEARLLEWTYANGSLRAQIGHDGGATFELENRILGGAIGMYAYDVGGLVRPIIVGDPDTDTDVTGDVNITLWNAAGADRVLEGLANSTTSLYYNGTSKLQTQDQTAAGNASGVDIVDGSGTMRPAGFNVTPHDTNNASNVPFTQAQIGYDIIHDNTTAYTWTTNASTGTAQTDIPVGSMWKCTNLGSGNITISPGASVTLYWLDGSGTSGSRTLGQWGTCTVYKYSNTQYHIWGTGLT